MTKIFSKFYKKLISISLVFLILFNATTQVFANIEFIPIPPELQAEIENIITNAVTESTPVNKTPEEFLADLLENLEEASKEGNPEQDRDQYRKLTIEEYTNLYTESINNEYKKYVKDIELKAKKAIDAFDKEAQDTIDEQNHMFNTELPILNFSLPTTQQAFGNTTTTNPLGQNLKLDIPRSTSYEQAMENIASRQATLDLLNESIAQQKEEYIAEVNAWKEKSLSALKSEKKNIIANVNTAYESYSQEYNTKLQEFYTELVEEVIENFKQTYDMESKKNFVSIVFFLSSIKSPEIDSNQFITGENRTFILNFLRNNFTAQGNACASSIKTRYKENYQYGTTSMLGPNPSAGKIFENSDSKESYLAIEDKDACDLALSSMLPYANLNGYAYDILNFVRQYYKQPLFGSMLGIAVKSLLLTENFGNRALTELIDESIRLENEARAGKTNFWGRVWDGLDIFTIEGITRRMVYDDKFCHHNLCSSANVGAESPNSWEEVAYMLAEADKTDLLGKAIDQCKIVSTSNYYQHMECKGIYPFLFGALIAKPELANKIQPVRQLPELPGPADTGKGVYYLSVEDAEKNKKINDDYDIIKKHTQGEWISAILTLQSFEDLFPADVLRMNNLVADSPILNPKHEFTHYDKDSDWYKKKVRRFNTKQVVLPLSAYADFLWAIIAIKDLFRFGFTMAQKVSTYRKMISVIKSVKGLPNSFNKAIKLMRLLDAKKIAPNRFLNFVKFNQKPLVYVTGRMSAIASKAGLESNAIVVSVSGRITGAKNGVLIGTREIARPLSSPRGKLVFKATPLGGRYVVAGADAFKVVSAEPTTLKGALAKIRQSIAESPFNPFVKPDAKNVPNLNLEGLTLEVMDKNGNPIKIEKITIEDDVLFINGEMFKTFKASVPEDQLEIIYKLIQNHNINLGIDGFYMKPLWNNKPSALERASARWHNSELFNIYDGSGNIIMQLGLNRGFKQDLNLMKELDKSAKLVYINNALHIQKGSELTRLGNIQGLSIPKTTIFNMTKGKQAAFLTDLFKMPIRTDQVPPLLFRKTSSKIFWPFMTQALSYSAASTSLMMTMEKPPFNFSPAGSVVIGLFLPYIWSFTSPFMVPLVKAWGAKPVLLGSMAVAGVGLGLAIANGYHGNVTNELDKEGRVIPKRDENGNIIPGSFLIRKDSPPVWPLFVASALTGLASSGIRASANILIKGYELNRSTLTASMLFKNIGGMAFTAVPFVANSLAKMDNDTFKDKRKDFSVTYPVLLGLTVVAGTGIALRMPKMNVPNYKPVTEDFLVKPWKLLFTPKVAPYTFGMMGISSLEGYVYFKGFNAFARDSFEDYGAQAENAKFMASVLTAIPQFALRFKSPRKVFYGYGLFNSALFATAGTLLLTVPSDNLSREENTMIGLAAGTLLGLGTAQVYQYSQKLVISQAKDIAHVSDIQTLYSMSNFGFILPTFYAMSASQRKENLNESEFEATRNTFYWPMLVYMAGAGAIADAERGFKVIPAAMNGFVKPALRYTIEGATLNRTVNNLNTYYKPTLLPSAQFTPLMLQPTPSVFKLQSPIIPHVNHLSSPTGINTNETNSEDLEEKKQNN